MPRHKVSGRGTSSTLHDVSEENNFIDLLLWQNRNNNNRKEMSTLYLPDTSKTDAVFLRYDRC